MHLISLISKLVLSAYEAYIPMIFYVTVGKTGMKSHTGEHIDVDGS